MAGQASSAAAASNAGSSANLFAQNQAIRQSILANAVPVIQNVRSGTVAYTVGSPSTVNVLASNVGLIRRFYLEITATVNCASSHTCTPTLFGIPNIISNIQFTDQNNRLRINTTGLHLHMASTQRKKRGFGSAILSASMSDPSGFGGNFPVNKTTGTVTGGTAKTFTWVYELEVVNSDQDLTGAIYANQTTSNNQIQFTFNPNMFVVNTADPFNAAWVTDVAIATAVPTLTNISWTLYQDFLDQLPTDPKTGFAVLPPIDIAYALVFLMINPGTIVQAQDNLYALPPFNVYQDLMLFWDNPAYNTAVGGDVNYIKTQIANTYILLQHDPLFNAIKSRNLIGTDFPAGIGAAGTTSGAIYDLNFRQKPLSVNQLSSTNIVFNPSTVNAGANLQIGQEYLWFANKIAA